MADEQTPVDKTTENGEGATPDNKGTDPAVGADGKDGASTEAKPEVKPAEQDDEPPARKRPIDYINERRLKRLEKAKEKGETTEVDMNPDDVRKIEKVVDDKYGAHFEAIAEKELETEVTQFIADNPDFKPYADKIRKFAAHPSRANIPIKSIAYEVAGDDLLKIGARRAKEADQEADNSSLSADASARDSVGGKSVKDMSKSEFAELQEKIRRGEKV